MARMRKWLGAAGGVAAGLVIGWLLFGPGTTADANGNSDRHDDFVICTGPIVQNFTQNPYGFELDGVWLLDYRAGKLLATAVNRNDGKLFPWAEVDLVQEFNLTPRANVHFLMTTGLIAKGMAALYVAETTSGKIAVYTMNMVDGLGNTGNGPVLQIRRHDQASFRTPRENRDDKKPAAAVNR
ncbi:MAG TPA: hypothetical protein PKD86_10340 [Gemmatales bacterium]|nr:hypothetical protein [Gemmatales bacterium]